MTGLYATVEICRRERALRKRRRTLIVAITAQAMAGIGEAPLDARMDDHLTKPVRQHDLLSAVAPWAVWKHRSENVAVGCGAPVSAGARSRVLRHDRIDGMCKGDPVFLAELVAAFLDCAYRKLSQCAVALRREDCSDLTKAAQGLKEVSLTIGAEGLAARAYELELRAWDLDLDGTRALFPAIELEWDALRFEIDLLAPGIEWPEPFDTEPA
jgi:CheY-like chemotaxis protein